MARRFAELMFTPHVKAVQERQGSRGAYERMEEADASALDHLGEVERVFIAARDSFYLATVSETGWPYVQHRGGPKGFLKVLDDRTIGFADYRGNRQYVSVGNLENDDRISLFLMDYPNRRRLKIVGHARIADIRSEPEMLERLRDLEYDARIERGMVIRIEGFDWNCPQHITPRFTETEIRELIAPVLTREMRTHPVAPTNAVLGSGPLELVIAGMRQLTPRVRAYELRAPNHAELPAIAAGAHIGIPVALEDGHAAIRTYSISSDPARRDVYEIAVLREEQGRGGSRAVHRDFTLGLALRCEVPRNSFALHQDARPAVLIAGGIGITPLKAMAHELTARAIDTRLHYATRSRDELAYRDALTAMLGERASFHTPDARLDVRAALEAAPADAVVYVCGPARLIDAVSSAAAALGFHSERVRAERFSAAQTPVDGQAFDIRLQRSGARVRVRANETVLDALESAGVPIASNCRSGICGTCVARVTAGDPDHRDTVLSPSERARGLLTTCVSRALSAELVLDL